MKYIIESKWIGQIPVLEMVREDLRKRSPLVIMLHGFSRNKEQMLEYGLEFAKLGYFICLFDASLHGELKPAALQTKEDFYNLPLPQILAIYEENARSINALLDAYENHPLADWNRVGLLGNSMGAMALFKYLTHYCRSNIQAAASLIGSPCWYNIIWRHLEQSGRTGAVDSAHLEFIKQIEPWKELGNLKSIPLLIQNGEADPRMPIQDLRELYRILQTNYLDSSRLKFIEYPEIGHWVTDSMINEAKNWFGGFLNPNS